MNGQDKQRIETKRAVLYARVSGDDRSKDGRNLASQLEMCRQHAIQHGWTVVAEFCEDDRGASGASFELPELNRVLEMARAAEYDVLVVREIDRLSRKLAKQLLVEEELKRTTVQIEYVLGDYPDTPEGSLMKNVRAVIADYERLKIAERMARGRRLQVKAGSVLVSGRPPYGYALNRTGGKTTLVECEHEARVVRLIFAWYTVGDDADGPMSIERITSRLTEMHVPTFADTDTRKQTGTKKRGRGEWNSESVREMLHNETYAGVWHYGKRCRDLEGRWTRNPEDHLLTVEVPAIISRKTWDLVQARLIHNRQNARRNRKYQYLLGGRVICGRCGLKMTGYSHRREDKIYLYYRCPARTRRLAVARNCDSRGFRADHVDAAVWGWIRSILTDPTELDRGLQEYQTRQEEKNNPILERLAVVYERLIDSQAQLERLLDLYLAGDFSREMLEERRMQVETMIGVLKREHAELTDQLQTRTLTHEQISSIHEFAVGVAGGLEVAEERFDERRRIIELLQMQVTLVAEEGYKIAHATCMLGEDMLLIAPNAIIGTLCHTRQGSAVELSRVSHPGP